MRLKGRVSYFGGPEDSGVSEDEDLALYWEDSQIDEHPELFLDEAPPDTTGLARRLDPNSYYIATRWDYDQYSKDELRDMLVMIYAPATDRAFLCRPVDWGPADWTGRVADVSPGLLEALGLETDDEVEVIYPLRRRPKQVTVCISSGHSANCPGASGFIDETTEARDVVDNVADLMRRRGHTVYTFSDMESTSQQQNLERICEWHNSFERCLDVFVHFNANETTDKPMGTECLYVSQEMLAEEMATAIAHAGALTNRGPKYRDDLYVLNHTTAPGILIEVCFVDSSADVAAYNKNFEAICTAIALTLAAENAIA